MSDPTAENGEQKRRSRSRSRDKKRHRSSHGRSRSHRSRSRSRSRRRRSRRRSRTRSRSRSRGRSIERPSPPRRRSPSPPKPVMSELEERLQREARAQRTVMVYQLFPKVDERDLFLFFSNVGTVDDIQLIRDQRTKKSKGLAYVEFREPEALPKALALTGQLLGGYPISITYTQAEKNDLHAKAQPSEYGMRLYIGSLHQNVSEDDLRPIFEAFGPIDYIEVQKDSASGESKGYGFVQYRNIKDAKAAMSQLDGLDVAGRSIRVSMSDTSSREPSRTGAAYTDDPTVQLDDTDSGTALSASARAALMARLSNQGKAGQLASQGGTAPDLSSNCVRITNMFDPTAEKEAEWDLDIKEDVEEECNKHGRVRHCYVDKNSLGHVYVRFGNTTAAQKVVNTFNGRFFAGRKIQAAFFPEDQYSAKFPSSTR